jgi:hypothetical protein
MPDEVKDAEIARLTAERDEALRVRDLAQKLVARLDIVHADDQYKSVWQLYMIHGGDYADGPKYDKELDALRAALGGRP